MGGLTTIWKYKGIKLAIKVKLVKALVFPIVQYGAETTRKAERKIHLRCGVGGEVMSVVDREKN